MGIIDTHAHVTYKDLADRIDEIVANALKHDVTKILCVCCTKEEALKAIEIANQYDIFDCAFGYHPEDVDRLEDSDLSELRKILNDPHMIALGEIGLDYHYTKENKEAQKDLFIRQIQLANELDLPILIHMRDATLDTLEILKKYPCTGIMHCFSGSPEFALECVKKGFYIAFGGVVTFKNAIKPKETAKVVPLEKIVLETDAPYLTPHPFRGKLNAPYYIPLVAEEIASLKGITQEEVARVTTSNANQLFSF